VGVGYALVLSKEEECLQEETMRESNKKQEEDPGMPGSKDPDAGAPGLSKYQNTIMAFLAMDILV
jgi:hypothetical protein